MEDSFRVRVDKAFGSLEPTTEPSSLSSLWSLTDEEIKRIEWNRRRDDHPDDTEPKPYPSKFDGFVAKLQNLSPPGEAASIPHVADLNDLSDGCVESSSSDSDEEEEKGKKSVQLTKPEDHDDEEWDIRTSVGLDCTLDLEEEEDEFDKTAVGSDDAGDRIYMKNITGNMADGISFYDELPETFEDASRDPRANHTAAKLRLIEDAETTGKFDSLRVSDTQNRTEEEDATNLKSILKRKEKQVDPKLEKRVRFDPECNDDEEEGAKQVAAFQAAVPDYIRNPSKYKHYTFDSLGDLDEESNRNACMSFLNQVMKSDDPPADLQKPVRFTPRKKPSDTVMKNESSISNKGAATISIAAEELQLGSGTCDMEEDEAVAEAAIKTSGSLKRGRRYRTKDDLDLDELPNV